MKQIIAEIITGKEIQWNFNVLNFVYIIMPVKIYKAKKHYCINTS